MEKRDEKSILPLLLLKSIIYYIDRIIVSVGVLLRVAFFTLVERKIIGLAHYRKGPAKTLVLGLTQPFRDALKLLTKENNKLYSIKRLFFTIGPAISIFLMLVC